MEKLKIFKWDPIKNSHLEKERGITFENIVQAMSSGGLHDIVLNKNYPHQKIFVVGVSEYAYLVPFIEEEDYIFLKTIMPSRVATKNYLNP